MYSRYQFTFFQLIMKQNQISCICHHTWIEDNEVLRFQRICDKYFNSKNHIKTVFATIYYTYRVTHWKDSNDLCDKFAKIYYSAILELLIYLLYK